MELGEELEHPPPVQQVADPGAPPSPQAEPALVAPTVPPPPRTPEYDAVKASVTLPRCVAAWSGVKTSMCRVREPAKTYAEG
jgi:hypothetical protein